MQNGCGDFYVVDSPVINQISHSTPHRVFLIIDLPFTESQYGVKNYNSYILVRNTTDKLISISISSL